MPEPLSALSRQLSVVAARERGVGPEQLTLIGVDADIFEVFYREHVEGIEGFVARRVGDRDRVADLTAEIFLAAIDSADRYRPRLGTPKAWLLGIARVLVANDVRHDSSGRLVKDFASKAFRGRREFAFMTRLAVLPTEPEALRLTVENSDASASPLNPSPAGSPRGGATVGRLLEILSEPFAGPALRAAAFDALAEIPGIGLERNVTDTLGRRGDAIAWVRERGFGRRWIFDPRTSRMLAQAEMIFGAPYAAESGVPPGTVFRETAYLRPGIVDSTR